ncbi:MAG: hypothetical protein RBU45_05490 [Myxococcota bacterium]|nr:hypothetical protein [Myxococcota bacterium]
MLRFLLFLLLMGVVAFLTLSLYGHRRSPARLLATGREGRWRELAAQHPRFGEALAVRDGIRTLLGACGEEDRDPRLVELAEKVDLLLERIAAHLTVLAQVDLQLVSFEPARLQERADELLQRRAQAGDDDTRRLLSASLHEVERQLHLRDQVRIRRERLLSSVEHTVLQLQAVHLDLVNVFSAGTQRDAGQIQLLRKRVSGLLEELGRTAEEAEEFARLHLEEEEDVETVGRSR